MSEQSIISARASVMVYDDAQKKWVPSGSSSGLSKVQIFHHQHNNTFRVVGRKLQDHEVVINCSIIQGLKYNQATPTFHQWRDSKFVYGLNFSSQQDGEAFARAMLQALEVLCGRLAAPVSFAGPGAAMASAAGPALNGGGGGPVTIFDEDMGYRTMTREDAAIIQQQQQTVEQQSVAVTPTSQSNQNLQHQHSPLQTHHRTSSAPPAPQPPAAVAAPSAVLGHKTNGNGVPYGGGLSQQYHQHPQMQHAAGPPDSAYESTQKMNQLNQQQQMIYVSASDALNKAQQPAHQQQAMMAGLNAHNANVYGAVNNHGVHLHNATISNSASANSVYASHQQMQQQQLQQQQQHQMPIYGQPVCVPNYAHQPQPPSQYAQTGVPTPPPQPPQQQPPQMATNGATPPSPPPIGGLLAGPSAECNVPPAPPVPSALLNASSGAPPPPPIPGTPPAPPPMMAPAGGGGPPPPPPPMPTLAVAGGGMDMNTLAAQLQLAKLKRCPAKAGQSAAAAENSGSSTSSGGSLYGTIGRSTNGMANMMDEMAKTLARRRAQVDKKPEPEQPNGNGDEGGRAGRQWEKSNTLPHKLGNSSSATASNNAPANNGSSNSGSESPRPSRKRFGSASEETILKQVGGDAMSLATSQELDNLRVEIVREVRAEIQKAKQEILDAIRTEFSRR